MECSPTSKNQGGKHAQDGRSPRQLWNALLLARQALFYCFCCRSPRQLWNALLHQGFLDTEWSECRSPRQLWNALLHFDDVYCDVTFDCRSPRQLWNALLPAYDDRDAICGLSQSPSIMECSPTGSV